MQKPFTAADLHRSEERLRLNFQALDAPSREAIEYHERQLEHLKILASRLDQEVLMSLCGIYDPAHGWARKQSPVACRACLNRLRAEAQEQKQEHEQRVAWATRVHGVHKPALSCSLPEKPSMIWLLKGALHGAVNETDPPQLPMKWPKGHVSYGAVRLDGDEWCWEGGLLTYQVPCIATFGPDGTPCFFCLPPFDKLELGCWLLLKYE